MSTVPAAGGWLWMRAGHSAVFQAAAALALVMPGFSLLVPARRE
jgi:hypothetical protein